MIRDHSSDLSRRRLIRALAGTGLAALAATGVRAAEEDWVPFDDSAGHLRLDGSLNGRPARILLDSGASHVVIDGAFAAGIGLAPTGGAGAMNAVGKSVKGAWAPPVAVRMGSFIWETPRAMITPLPTLPSDPGVDVVLGLEAFVGLPMEIDLTGKRLRLVHGAPDLEGATRLPLRRGPQGMLFVDVAIEGAKPLPALFDTGSGHALVADRALARTHRLLAGRQTSDGLLVSVAERTEVALATLRSVSLGGVRMTDVPLTVLPVAVQHTPLILGLPVIGQLGRIIVDARSGALFLFPAETRPGPFLKNRTGLSTMPLPQGGWRVEHVARGSAAAGAGWKVGELISTVDGKRAPPPEWRTMNHAAGSRVRYEMADGSVRELERKDYY